jgi:hypothetical protein
MARVQNADEEVTTPLVAARVPDDDDVENPLMMIKKHGIEPVALGTMLDDVKCFMISQAESREKYELSSSKRPGEPYLNLDYIRERELDVMLREGEASAEKAALDAGFLGGNSRTVIALFLLFGTVVGCAALTWYIRFVNFKEGRKGKCESLGKTVLFLLYYCSISFAFYGRAYYLIKGDSINALVVLGRGATCVDAVDQQGLSGRFRVWRELAFHRARRHHFTTTALRIKNNVASYYSASR